MTDAEFDQLAWRADELAEKVLTMDLSEIEVYFRKEPLQWLDRDGRLRFLSRYAVRASQKCAAQNRPVPAHLQDLKAYLRFEGFELP